MNERDVAYWRKYARQCALSQGLRGDDLDDAAQDAVIAILRVWGTARDPHGLYCVVARRETMDYAEREARRRHDSLDALYAKAEVDKDPHDVEVEAPLLAPAPYDPNELIDAVRALNDLPIRQRIAVETTAEGSTNAEIAEALGAEGTEHLVRSLRKRARRSARATVSPDGPTFPPGHPCPSPPLCDSTPPDSKPA